MRTNTKAVDPRKDTGVRLAGGYGALAARQDPEGLLRRAVLSNLLFEDLFYEDGVSVVEHIRGLVPQVDPKTVVAIAVEARVDQGLRHVPLLLAREMARLDTHKGEVGNLLPRIILRPDELPEFLALYWRDGRHPLSNQVKRGLARSFEKFDEYQLAKWRRDDAAIKLRDVLFMVHPTPPQGKEKLYKQIANNTLPTPDTWEVALSGGKDKKATWERLIRENRLGALAFLRNLHNMDEANVDHDTIRYGFEHVNPRWLVPLDYLKVALVVHRWQREIEDMMYRGLAQAPKLPGTSVFVVDVSGSMNHRISEKSDFSRQDAGAAMAVLAAEMCEHVSIYATAGNDGRRKHETELVAPSRGFGLVHQIANAHSRLGGGGIFTRQCLEYIREHEQGIPDRIIVFSDSQDCDDSGSRTPTPFGKYNYIVDVSAERHGVNYAGLWTAEISGWSSHFLRFIAAVEEVSTGQEQEEVELAVV